MQLLLAVRIGALIAAVGDRHRLAADGFGAGLLPARGPST
jgi:hypothetical protein